MRAHLIIPSFYETKRALTSLAGARFLHIVQSETANSLKFYKNGLAFLKAEAYNVFCCDKGMKCKVLEQRPYIATFSVLQLSMQQEKEIALL